MKVQSNLLGQSSKKQLLALSCATALASLALIAKPVAADQVDQATPVATDAITVSDTSNADLVQETQPDKNAITDTPVTEATGVTVTGETSQTSEQTQANPESETKDQLATSDKEETEASTKETPTDATLTRTEAEQVTDQGITGGSYFSDQNGNWYYRDAQGQLLTGEQTIDGQKVYFRDNGQQVKGAFTYWSGGNLIRYYDQDTGVLWTNRYVAYNGNWYYLGQDGRPVTGAQTIDGQEVYFNTSTGIQVKGDFSPSGAYYDSDTGAKVTTEGFITNPSGQTFYLDDQGIKVAGLRDIDGHLYFFTTHEPATGATTGVLVKGKSVSFEGEATAPRPYGYGQPTNITRRYYFDAETGQAVTNRFINEAGAWYYYGPDGNAIRPEAGEALINGQVIYLDQTGRQAKGELVLDNGILRYYDADTGQRVTNTSLTINGMTYHFDAEGKGTDVPDAGHYYSDAEGNWYFQTAEGVNLTGAQIINGQQVYFRQDGKQVKGPLATTYGKLERYYDVDTGQLWTNRYVAYNGDWYYLGPDGTPLTGEHTIDGQDVFFDLYQAKQVKGGFGRNGVYLPEYYYDKDTGAKATQASFVPVDGYWYYHDAKGQKVLTPQTINGKTYYFKQAGAYKYTTIGMVVDINGQAYSYNPQTGITTLGTQVVTFDENGLHD